jgi:hypothetical protein
MFQILVLAVILAAVIWGVIRENGSDDDTYSQGEKPV